MLACKKAYIWLVFIILLLPVLVMRAHSQNRVGVSEGLVHPTKDNIPEVTDSKRILRASPRMTFMDQVEYDSITVGVNEGMQDEMFGYIVDARMDQRMGIAVLDAEYSEVRVYDYRGKLIGKFGAKGKGPGEFLHPRQLAITNAGRTVFVLTAERRVSVFERYDSTEFRLKSTIATEVGGVAGCAMNGHLYLLAYSPEQEGIIHKFSPEGEHITSFGAPYISPNPFMVESQSRRGLLACSEEYRLVGLIRENIPALTAYTDTGDIAWQVRFADFESYRVVETIGSSGAPSVTYQVPQPGQSRFEHMFTDSSGDFYVQYYTAVRTGRAPLHLFKIDAETGVGRYFGTARPIADLESPHLLSVRHGPFPHLVIYRRRGLPK